MKVLWTKSDDGTKSALEDGMMKERTMLVRFADIWVDTNTFEFLPKRDSESQQLVADMVKVTKRGHTHSWMKYCEDLKAQWVP